MKTFNNNDRSPQPHPQGLLWFGARRTCDEDPGENGNNSQPDWSTFNIAFSTPDYEFSFEGARLAKGVLLKRFQNVLFH